MGTKVQCKSYLPGYHSLRDLSEDTSSSWPVYYEDMMLSGQFYNGFTPRPVNGYSEYDKEVFRQTMLKHESIFRKQVYELHRLYRVQKDLMNELKKRELCDYSVQERTSPSAPFSSQQQFIDTERMWQMPHSPVLNANYSRPSVSGLDDVRYPLNFLNGCSTQAGSDEIPTKNGVSLKDENSLGSGHVEFPRRMLDLQLPADAYIDCEDTEETNKRNVSDPMIGVTDLVNRNCDIVPMNDVKLTLSTGESPIFRNESWQLVLDLQHGSHGRNIADLNEPIEDVSCEESAVSNLTKFPETACHEEIQGHQVPVKPKPSLLGQPKEFLQERHRDEGTYSGCLLADKEDKRKEWAFFKQEPGLTRSDATSFSPSFYYRKLPTSPEPEQVMLKKPYDQNKGESCLEKLTHEIELSGRSHLSNTSYSRLTASSVLGSHSAVSCSDNANIALPFVSSLRKPTYGIGQVPIAIQALPCLKESAPPNIQSKSSSTSTPSPGVACDKWHYKGELRLHPSFGTEETSYSNSFHHDFSSDSNSTYLHLPSMSFDKPDLRGKNSACENSEVHGHQKYSQGLCCMDVKSAKDMNLNLELPNGFHHDSALQQNLVLCDADGGNENLSGQISWLKTKMALNESFRAKQAVPQTQSCSQLTSKCAAVAQEYDRRRNTGNSPSQDVPRDDPLTFHANTTRIQSNGVPDSLSNKKIPGFCVLERTQHTTVNSSSIPHQKCSATDDAKNSMNGSLLHSQLSCNIQLLNWEKQIPVGDVMGKSVGNSDTGFRNQINLNSMETSMDQSKSPEISSKDEAKIVPSPISVPSVAAKVTYEIDLEAAVSLQEEDYVLSMEETPRTNFLFRPAQILQGEPEFLQESEGLHETPVREAAEVMVTMSLHKCSPSDGFTCRPSTPAIPDLLQWFADVVSSNADALENVVGMLKREGDGDHRSSKEDDMDYFESMTLKLTETKMEEYCCSPWEQEKQKEEEETTIPSLLLSKHRKGQARRRRQRRDFQKDILPGLTSLSRHEVTEDLQFIGGLIRASGQSWQTGVTRRNMVRNGCNGQARGRRRPRGGSTAAIVRNQVPQLPPMPRQLDNTELEVDGKSIMGWGRTTRRCRRLRCPMGNIPASLT